MDLSSRYLELSVTVLIFFIATGATFAVLKGYKNSISTQQLDGRFDELQSGEDEQGGETDPGSDGSPEESDGQNDLDADGDNSAALPLSLLTGLIAAVLSLAVFEGGRKSAESEEGMGRTARLLLEAGLGDMTLERVRLLDKMRKRKKFTIKEITRTTEMSRQSVWKLVQRLIDEGIVRESGERNGNGGRGKPEKIYRYEGIQP